MPIMPKGIYERTPRRPFIDRYFDKVEFTDECWLWTAAKSGVGYGLIQEGRADQKLLYAHRFIYEFCVAPIPDGLVIDHLCRVRHCVNPEHLEVVTLEENSRRGNF